MTKIAPSILVALRDCASFRLGHYVWKPKTMEKAVALGLAKKLAATRHGVTFNAFVLTDSGRAAIAEKDL